MLSTPLNGLGTLFLTIDDCKTVRILFPYMTFVWKMVLGQGLDCGNITERNAQLSEQRQ